jgi:hypothetical protein
MMSLCSLFVLALLLLPAVPVPAQQAENLGAHRFGGMDEFQKVIETKCTVCHTRERVDIAIRKRQNFEEIEKTMLSRGAALTERDKKVLGAFWGDPLKENKGSIPAGSPSSGPPKH